MDDNDALKLDREYGAAARALWRATEARLQAEEVEHEARRHLITVERRQRAAMGLSVDPLPPGQTDN